MKLIKYITITLFALASVCMWLCGCYDKAENKKYVFGNDAAQAYHDSAFYYYRKAEGVDSVRCIAKFYFWHRLEMDEVKKSLAEKGELGWIKDTVYVHDTIYRTKVTHINHANSVIIGRDSNGEIIQN